MFRRSVLHLSSRQSVAKIPFQVTSQIPSYLSSRGFSATSNQPELSGPTPNENQKSPLLKIFGGGLLLGSVSYATYHYNLVGKYLLKEPQINTNKTLQDFPKINENIQQQEVTVSEDLNANILTPKPSEETAETVENTVETVEKTVETDSDSKLAEEKIEIQEKEDINHIEEEKKLNTETNESLEEKKPEIESDIIQNNPDLVQNEAIEYIITEEIPQVQSEITEQKNPLHDEYYLTEKKSKDLNEGYISKDGKLVLDFLEAIHEAEKRQAYLDARTFNEEMRLIKEKYDKELKDARARELMYAEKEVILDKELTRERAKAVAALKSLQEKLEEKHKLELEAKEKETELKLKEIQELAKAELTAAITSEKASQIEKMTEANIHINALCMAFYARSEEARQSHSVHKLALGALALEDALSKGLPIQKEIEAIKTYIEGIDKDSFLDLVLSSLPEEPRTKGTDTLLQLNEKFDGLKQTLRHFSLIPPGGGGILAHSLAHVASRLKVKEVDLSGEGIESVISKVEKLLGQGKLSEAANTLEEGVKGSQAEEIVEEWVTRVRYRAIAEQALVLLQSYATSISLN